MRRTILALTVIFLVPTAVMALTAGREQVRDTELGAAGVAVQKRQIAPGDVAGSGQAGNVILTKGDKSGTGPGRGGHKGAKKGERKGGQKHDKS
jgi:hypothetical protein